MLHIVLEFIVLLAKVLQIPTKTPIHIFEGFTLYSVRKFKDPFSLLLNQEHVTQLNLPVGIFNKNSATLICVKSILHHSYTSYYSICTSNDYFMQGHAKFCWNYGGDYGLRYFQTKKNKKANEGNKRSGNIIELIL